MFLHCIHDKQRRRRSTESQCSGHTECYCIPVGDCFIKSQYVDVSHCELKEYVETSLNMDIIVQNQAGLTTPLKTFYVSAFTKNQQTLVANLTNQLLIVTVMKFFKSSFRSNAVHIMKEQNLLCQ